jgi:mannan endo-1,4-beta-mannosidase
MLSLVLAAALMLAPPHDSFVTRSGSHLELAGKTFRFGGANVEWLGLVGYGPFDPSGPHYPSHYEIDDALATAQELGARVVRAQTLGDSVGCSLCIEPALGQFNAAAFEPIDYALAAARRRGLKLIATIVGDDAAAGGSGCVYLRWRGIDVPGCSLVNMAPFWTDETVRADVEQHIDAVLNHVNRYTHVAYKNDPTIFGWDLLNGGGSPRAWTRAVVAHLRSVDRRHLVLSRAPNAVIPGVDVCVAFVYPHWQQPWSSLRDELAACKSARRPFVAYEYGWDRTNYRTVGAFRRFLATLAKNPLVAGDAFWALQAHEDGHGWMPIPANTSNRAAAARVETGQWWALYYTGIRTLVNTAADMAARAQVIRAHNYAFWGRRVPPHALPPRPTTITSARGRLYWQGSAGARDYSIQRAPGASGPWRTVCTRCVTDAGNGFPTASGSWYRVIPYNLDGKPGQPSKPARS